MKRLLAALLLLISAPSLADWLDDRAAAHARGDYTAELEIARPYAIAGNAYAQVLVGTLYSDGQGVTQNYEEAVKWYRLAAAQGNDWAELFLGAMYSDGEGVAQDYVEAVRLYRLAAAQGNALAQSNLGVRYEFGHGVLQDYVRAHMWYNLAAVSGKAEKAAKNRDDISRKMTLQQVAEAQKLARECVARNLKGC